MNLGQVGWRQAAAPTAASRDGGFVLCKLPFAVNWKSPNGVVSGDAVSASDRQNCGACPLPYECHTPSNGRVLHLTRLEWLSFPSQTRKMGTFGLWHIPMTAVRACRSFMVHVATRRKFVLQSQHRVVANYCTS